MIDVSRGNTMTRAALLFAAGLITATSITVTAAQAAEPVRIGLTTVLSGSNTARNWR
jgi:hypothetical protein